MAEVARSLPAAPRAPDGSCELSQTTIQKHEAEQARQLPAPPAHGSCDLSSGESQPPPTMQKDESALSQVQSTLILTHPEDWEMLQDQLPGHGASRDRKKTLSGAAGKSTRNARGKPTKGCFATF